MATFLLIFGNAVASNDIFALPWCGRFYGVIGM